MASTSGRRRAGRWWTPESTLHLSGMAGGATGPAAVAAEVAEALVSDGVLGTVLVNCWVLVCLHTPQGGAILAGLLGGDRIA